MPFTDPAMAACLHEVAHTLPTLIHLDISGCAQLGDATVAACGGLLQLQLLNLRGTKVRQGMHVCSQPCLLAAHPSHDAAPLIHALSALIVACQHLSALVTRRPGS